MNIFRKLNLLRQEELEALRQMAGPGELGNLALAAEDARVAWKLHCPFPGGRISETRFKISAETFSMSRTMELTRLTR